MSLRNTISFIVNHPLNKGRKLHAVFRFLKWQINTKLNPYPVIFPFGERSKLIVRKGLTGATGNLYCGLHEFEDMSFLLHFLRDSDLFVDIGANVGSYTILAANERNVQTVSIEPVPDTFELLNANIALNKILDKVRALNIGLGSEKGVLKFTKSFDTMNHVATDSESNTINVQINKFDNLITLEKETLVKIDVEGFETEVLKGMDNAFSSMKLKALIIELNGSSNRYGYDENLIHEKLLSFGFAPYSYMPFKRELKKLEKYDSLNTIYIRDLEFVVNRVRSAESFKINGNLV